MSAGYNNVQVMGYLLDNGSIVKAGEEIRFMTTAVEVIDRVKRGENWEDRTQNFGVLIPGKRAVGLTKLGKPLQGTRVFIEGQLVKGAKDLYIEAREVILCGRKKEDNGGNVPPTDDEIPF